MTRKPLAIIDVETTGCNPLRDRVIEIAVIRTDGAGEFSTLINPERSVPPFITSLTGISSADLAEAPLFEEIAPEIAELLEGAVFTAHNARFDYGFVRNEFRRIGISFSAPTLCTVRLSRKLYPKQRKHSLESIIGRHGISVEQRHRALDDARAVEAYLALSREEVGDTTFSAALTKLMRFPSLPARVSEDQIRDLPDGPGVYLFYGEKGEILYIGKSINIRDRVLSHFAGDHGSAKEMALCSRVAAIEPRRTPGELSALLLESDLIKELSPLYNRRLKKRRKVIRAELAVTEAGYETIRYSVETGIEADPNTAIARFRSMRHAEEVISSLAKAFELCPKLLGIEKGKGACFSLQLNRCRGACVGQENPDSYNQRFQKAFSSRLLADWPYSSPVLVTEGDGDGQGMAYAVDQWRILASFEFESSGTFQVRDRERSFDLDIYTILSGFLSNPNGAVSIRTITNNELAVLLEEE